MKFLSGLIVISVLLGVFAFSVGAEEELPKAVYNRLSWDCKVEGNKFLLIVDHKVTINASRGDDYAEFGIWINKFESLKEFEATVFGADGNKIYSRDKGDLDKACGYGGYSLYADQCYYFVELKGPVYPYSVEYRYVVEGKSLFFWPGATFQRFVPVELAEYTLSIRDEDEFSYKQYNFDNPPEVEIGDGWDVYRWQLMDIPELEKIDYLPYGLYRETYIVFRPEEMKLGKYKCSGSEWSDIGRFAQPMYADNINPTPPSRITPLPDSKPDLVKALYDEVRDDIRYVSISIGTGGWVPHDAETVAEVRYGDCKDMTTLLISRLRQNGIESYPALLMTRDKGWTDVDFPRRAFNHVIAVAIVDNDTVWMDPTCDNCEYGQIRWDDEDVPSLIVTDSGGVLRQTPAGKPENNKTSRSTSFFLHSDLSLEFETRMEIIGHSATRMRNYLASFDKADEKEYIHDQFHGANKKYRIESYTIENQDDCEKPLVVSIEARMIKKARKIGDVIYIEPMLYNYLWGLEREDLTDRDWPINLFYPDRRQDHYSLKWDSTLDVSGIEVSANDSLRVSFGDVSFASQIWDDSVTVDMTKTYYDYEVDTSAFDEFESLREKLKNCSKKRIKLTSPFAN